MLPAPARSNQIPQRREKEASVELFDPDPKSMSGQSARVIGYSPTAAAVLVIILVRRDDRPGSWWGANGWRANSTDRRIYAEGSQPHE
jgi:hypothetical protein